MLLKQKKKKGFMLLGSVLISFLISYVTFGKSLHLSETQLLIHKMGLMRAASHES